jgi:hypothetical protein
MLCGWIGAKLAINKEIVLSEFLVVVVGTLIRFAYDVFFRLATLLMAL